MDHRQYRQWAAKVASRWGVMWDKGMGRERLGRGAVEPGRWLPTPIMIREPAGFAAGFPTIQIELFEDFHGRIA